MLETLISYTDSRETPSPFINYRPISAYILLQFFSRMFDKKLKLLSCFFSVKLASFNLINTVFEPLDSLKRRCCQR